MSATNITPPRSFSALGERTVIETKWTSSGWKHMSTSTSSATLYNGSEGRTSVTTPGYPHLREVGRLPENYFGYSRFTDWKYAGNWITETPKLWRTETNGPRNIGTSEPFVTVSSLLSANLGNQVKQKALEKIKDQNVNLAVVYGERAQSMRTIGDAFNRLAKAANALKRGDFGKAAAALGVARMNSGFSNKWRRNQSRAFASGWLELQYGWLPIINDVYGSLESLEKSRSRDEYVIVRAARNLQETASRIVDTTEVRTTHVAETTFSRKALVKMTRSSVAFSTLAELGLTNPAQVAWELVPYSFVWDWVMPIGAFLNQIDATSGWSFASGSVTSFDRESVVSTQTKNPSYLGPKILLGSISARKERIDVSREGLTGFSDLYHLPTFKDPSSLTHTANALALFQSSKR